MINYKNNKMNEIKPLKVGDGKEKPRFSLELIIKRLKISGFKFIMRW